MNDLGEQLRQRIRAQGAVSVAEFMDCALADPQLGYYRRKDPLGKAGDFITAPEISQMFGELLGLWGAVVWQSMGQPAQLVLAELGPGRGTLMADFLRAAQMVPGFRQALSVHLVETSPALREKQRQTLATLPVCWHDRIEDLPAGPLLVVANEFFDALPIRQFVKRADGWHERLVGLAENQFVFTDGAPAVIDAPPAAEGDIFEVGEPAQAIAARLGQRLVDGGGAALVIDYGHAASGIGDTLQAVRDHRMVPVFDEPGESDLTAHVDFETLARAAQPARASETLTQGAFLRSLGIEVRAERLMASQPAKADVIASSCRRLIEPSGMGTLFKVRAFTHPGLPIPPGFSR